MDMTIDPQWLMTFALLAAVPVALLVVLTVSDKDRKNDLRRRLEGIRLNGQIKQLLTNLQQHRGMVNAILSGDHSFASKISKKQEGIESDLRAIGSRLGDGLLTTTRWENIRENWQALHQQALQLAPEESFKRHSDLIREVLHCMGDVAERTQVGGVHPVDPALVDLLWSKLPAAAEGVGQARGMGASVAARGHCSSVARIKLRFLEERIRETMQRVSADLARIDSSRAGSLAGDWQEANGAVIHFLDLLESALLNVERPTLDAGHYFDTATQALDAVFRVYDRACGAMESALTN